MSENQSEVRSIIQQLLEGGKELLEQYFEQKDQKDLNMDDIRLPQIDEVLIQLQEGINNENQQIKKKYTQIGNQIIKYQDRAEQLTKTLLLKYTEIKDVEANINEIIKQFCNIAEICVSYPKQGHVRKIIVLSSLHIFLKQSAVKDLYNTMIEQLIDKNIDLMCEAYDHSVKQRCMGCIKK